MMVLISIYANAALMRNRLYKTSSITYVINKCVTFHPGMFGLRAMSGIFIGLLFVSLSYASNTLPWGQAVNVSVDAPIVFLDLQVPASNSAGFAFVSVFIASLQPSPLSLYASWTNSAPNASNFDFVAINRGFLAQGGLLRYFKFFLSLSLRPFN